MRYSAPKSEMLAAIYFIEKYRPYLTREVFTLRTDNQALSWLKRYSMTRGMAARWIQRLDQYKFRVEHRKREKHQNVDSLSKKTEFYAVREERDASLPPEMENFKFLDDPELYRRLPPLEEKGASCGGELLPVLTRPSSLRVEAFVDIARGHPRT